jgi:DNA topoisomerase-3
MKSLIIAEKPSVAVDISRALGGFKRQGDYFESDDYVLSSAVGHLIEIGMPEEEEVKRGKWTFAHLPAIPTEFALKPIEKTSERLNLLLKLMKRKDVTALINACDAGREGELIFRYITRFAGTKKPIKRLWLQSMTATAIKEGFAALRTDEEMLSLEAAATCRSESDWLIGINGTRAMTAFNSKSGGFQLTTVGRVQTPTLAILVDREKKIRAFVPKKYWELIGTFEVAAGAYTGRWFDESFKKNENDPDARAERLFSESKAKEIAARCLGKPATVTEESKSSTQSPPLLYDLTTLQREANTRFGFSARTTLSLAQALYEKHKVLTYPRTDARALPEDYIPTVKQTLKMLSGMDAYGEFADTITQEKRVVPNKRIFDNSKISDHFAIIPTLLPPKKLSEIEAKLYDMVVRRFLAVFYPPAEFLLTTRISKVGKDAFKTEGKILVNPGYLAVYGKAAHDDDDTLVAVKKDEKAKVEHVAVNELSTRPPARFTEATLLSAMEGAGKTIEDEELREAMLEKGLGTPATRAQIIEGLLLERYVFREGKELTPTAKAFSLMTLLHGLGVPELFSPEMTAEWEFKLGEIERGRSNRNQFMKEIVKMTKHIVSQAKNYESDTIPGDFSVLHEPCPKCGGEVHEQYKKFQCVNPKCEFGFWKIMGGRQIEPIEADILLKTREIGPLDGFRSRLGRPFSARIILSDEYEVKFDFESDAAASGEPVDLTGLTPLGKCPKCSGKVYEQSGAYVCEQALGAEKGCDFRVGKTILQCEITVEQMQKLLNGEKTDLLKFVSARTRRPFSAFLTLQAGGKLGFEFEERSAAAPRARGEKPTPLRVLGKHPDGEEIGVYLGRYGHYLKHGNTNAGLSAAYDPKTITLEDALKVIAEKESAAGDSTAKAVTKKATAKVAAWRAVSAEEKPAAKKAVKKAAKKTSAKKTPAEAFEEEDEPIKPVRKTVKKAAKKVAAKKVAKKSAR